MSYSDSTKEMTEEIKTIPEQEAIQSPSQSRETVAENAEPVSVEPAEAAASPWWRIADFGVFGLWVAIVAYILPYHEKWADEAQAWLIARDLDLKTIWFHELRYEGSPGLWHTILWVAQHVFHAKYDSIGKIGAACAAAGVVLLIFAAPFPRYIRWPLAFTYFMIYQYAVIARPYTLLPLLAFTAALLFKDLKHPERMTIVLVLLANLSLHGTILAGCLGLVYLMDAFRAWKTFDRSVKRRYWICIAVMVATFAFIAVILKPTPDIEEFVLKKQFAQLTPEEQQNFPTVWKKLAAVLCGAYVDWLAPSILFAVLIAIWSSLRRRFLVFALPVGVLIGFYGIIHGAAHHHGTVFVATIVGIWIAWPTRDESAAFSMREQWAIRGIVILLLSLCIVNIWDSIEVLRREYRYPYSGAEDAANYLTSVGAERGPMFGFLFGTVGVQAYFDRNIFVNMPTAYFHHGLPLAGTNLDIDELHRVDPQYIVAYSQWPEVMMKYGIPQLNAEGYELAHFSDGYYLYKHAVFEREVYFILRKTSP